MKTSRRKFIQNTSFAAAGIAIGCSQLTARKATKVISCSKENYAAATLAPPPQATISSTKNGDWSDVTVWGGRLPSASDLVGVDHTVILDLDATIAGANITGTLGFSPVKTCALQSTKSIIVTGMLNMAPMSDAIGHTLRFTGINENNYVGGGMDVLDTDTGLWVMEGGQLDIRGAVKTGWTNCIGGVSAGTTSIGLQNTDGWNIGDEIFIAPTGNPSQTDEAFITAFDNRTITGKSGTTITVAPCTFAHPMVNNLWTAEVANLTRNVKIEGTATGKSHIFIRSTKPQTIKYVQLRYMGPRKDTNNDGNKELVLGRYGLHFHHSLDGSRGSVAEGCVIRDTDNHAYVPHVSNGITFKGNISYKTKEAAFWWDEGEKSHDIIYDGNLIADCTFVSRSLALDSDPTVPNFAGTGMLLGMGDYNIARNNVTTGCLTGDPGNGAAYVWQANNEGVWAFTGNVAHNNTNGVFIWQNSTLNHELEDTIIYNNAVGVKHGAYANIYTFRGGYIYNNQFVIHASSGDSCRVRLESIQFNGVGVQKNAIVVESSAIPGTWPIFIRACSFDNFTGAAVIDNADVETKHIDIIQCTSTGQIAAIGTGSAKEVIRVQPASGQAVRITKAGTTNIQPFAPTVWGTGRGLQAEYFNNNSLSGSGKVTTDAVINFQQWSTELPYVITSSNHSVRWTGKIMAQYSQVYTFAIDTAGAVKLWINGQLMITAGDTGWEVKRSAGINLVAGQSYDIKLEYTNTDTNTGVLLYWACPSLPEEIIPQSQLYPGEVIIQPDQPTSNGGPDINITLPTSTVQLNGTATNGTPSWSQVSGGSATITSPNSASTSVTGLTAGTYIFRLTVGTAFDDVTVTVNPQVQTATITITASPNPTTTYWRVKVTSDIAGNINLKVISSTGVVKKNTTVANGSTTQFGGSYAKGTYILTATQGTVSKTIQLIKQ